MLKFLPGIIVIQMVAAALCYTAIQLNPEQPQMVVIIVALAAGFSVLAAFWFQSIAFQAHSLEMDTVKEEHAREREKIRVNAERQKTRLVNKSHKQLLRETRRVYTAASLKTGAAFASLLAIGIIMLYSQFATFGLLLLTTGGGALAGYVTRARQESGSRQRKKIKTKPAPQITTKKTDR